MDMVCVLSRASVNCCFIEEKAAVREGAAWETVAAAGAVDGKPNNDER